MQIYQEISQLDYPILGAEVARETAFQHPLLTSKPATVTQSAQSAIPLNLHKALGLSRSKMKWYATYIQIYQVMSQPDYPILGAKIGRARKRFQHPCKKLFTLCSSIISSYSRFFCVLERLFSILNYLEQISWTLANSRYRYVASGRQLLLLL